MVLLVERHRRQREHPYRLKGNRLRTRKGTRSRQKITPGLSRPIEKDDKRQELGGVVCEKEHRKLLRGQEETPFERTLRRLIVRDKEGKDSGGAHKNRLTEKKPGHLTETIPVTYYETPRTRGELRKIGTSTSYFLSTHERNKVVSFGAESWTAGCQNDEEISEEGLKGNL